MNAAELRAALSRAVEQLSAFHEIGKAITSTLEVHEVLSLVMQKVSELLRPSNWSLILQAPDGQLYFEICVGEGSEKLRDMRFPPGEGIAGTVFQTGVARRVDDVRLDPAFSARFDQESEFRTSSAIAVPLRSKGKTLGVIELVNGPGTPPFSEEDLKAVGVIADFAAIAIENARNFKNVQELTIVDEHTGLFNARHLRALIDQEIARAGRFNHPLSLIFFDLDHFKQVNDTHGHLVGSALLRKVGEVVQASIRQVDFAFRYGGDEFAVLLIETDAESARITAERIRERIQRGPLLPELASMRLTASVGVATFPDHASSAVQLLEAADQAMYRVKAEGRNGVACARTAA